MTRPPNILLLMADQHRADFLGTNPHMPIRTPNLDALARSGARFTNAVCSAPLCAPSRACMASGKNYFDCGVPDHDHDYPLDQPTYYQALAKAGYHVAGVGKFDLHKSTQYWGLDGSRSLREWGFMEGIDNEGKWDAITSGAREPKGPYMAHLHARGLARLHVDDFHRRHSYRDTHPTPLPDDAYCDNWLAANGLRMLRGFSDEKPWHLVVNFTGPHEPMDVTASMYEARQRQDFPLPHRRTEWDDATHQRVRQNYAAMIENIDALVGRLITLVRARGELDRTLIIYTSDHGEMLGDHGLWEKRTYRHPSVGIPMIVAGPGVDGQRVIDRPASLHDLAATMLESANARPLPDMDSRSLWPLLDGSQTNHREIVMSAVDDWIMGFDGRHKIVLRVGEQPLLFDLQEDPTEDADLSTRAPGEVERLLSLLVAEHAHSAATVEAAHRLRGPA